MLEQVLINLVVNARDAMPEGGLLTITTRQQEGSRDTALTALPVACLTVSDNGCGISPEILPRIFEPFFSTKEIGEGTGIGLATVYSIVEQHQGHVKAVSALGKGTAVGIHLPLLLQSPGFPAIAAAKGPMPDPGSICGGQGETVLVVDDEAPLRMLVRRLLERQGYRVVDAASGRRALDFFLTRT